MPTVIDGDTGVSQVQNGVIVQADLASGVAGTGPAFSVTMGASQSIANNTFTKLNFNTEVFDTNSNYDTATYRFTPNIAGYYQISVTFAIDNSGTNFVQTAAIFKNGVSSTRMWGAGSTGQYAGSTATGVVYLNGSTDYVEAYGFQNTGGSRTVLGGENSSFYGVLVRAA